MGWIGKVSSLSWFPGSVRPVIASCCGAGGEVDCVAGLDGGCVQGRGSGQVDRLVAGAVVCAVASDREQQPFLDADGAGRGAESGLSDTRAEPASCSAGHACPARFSGGSCGDLRGSVAFFGDLLSGLELAESGLDAGVFAGAGQSGPLAGERSAQGGLRVRTAAREARYINTMETM